MLSDKSNLIEHTWVRLIELGKLASVELVQNPFKKKNCLKGPIYAYHNGLKTFLKEYQFYIHAS